MLPSRKGRLTEYRSHASMSIAAARANTETSLTVVSAFVTCAAGRAIPPCGLSRATQATRPMTTPWMGCCRVARLPHLTLSIDYGNTSVIVFVHPVRPSVGETAIGPVPPRYPPDPPTILRTDATG